ncbi:hypothetical protein AGDE_02495 [Angomonas deanei]|nr:hypothetical protein AGDE_02495 [Angomonas deanei]|eukprot:EPY41429.1 hypothetical protein AGDE_02495 [Angomonas deanei]
MDLAVIEQTSFRHVQVNEVALSLNPSYLPKGSPVLIYGFRGNGQLGELDTLDAGVLDSLPEEERKQFLASLENVEGKQSGALCSALVVDPRGMCKGVSDVDQCFHGMSGSPLLSADHLSTGGILYGKHASCETNIGYVPSKEIVDWLKGALS